MEILEIRDRFRAALLEFIWSQWAQLGVSALQTRNDRWAVDPEALLLMSIDVARHDPRLYDEILDWSATNGRLLILQRLRNLSARFKTDAALLNTVIAWANTANPSLRWGASVRQPHKKSAKSKALFDPSVVSFVPKPDPVFAAFGYHRPLVERSGKSRPPEIGEPANLTFQLRMLFGPGTRSEIMRILLTQPHSSLRASEIADEAAFAKRNINETLSSLVGARVIKARWSKNQRLFRLDPSKWWAFLDTKPATQGSPTFLAWTHLLPALTFIYNWLESLEARTKTSLESPGASDLLAMLAPTLDFLGVEKLSVRSSRAGEDVLQAVIDSLLGLIEEDRKTKTA